MKQFKPNYKLRPEEVKNQIKKSTKVLKIGVFVLLWEVYMIIACIYKAYHNEHAALNTAFAVINIVVLIFLVAVLLKLRKSTNRLKSYL